MNNTIISDSSRQLQSNNYGDLRRFRPVVRVKAMRRLRRAGFNGPAGWMLQHEAEEFLRRGNRRKERE